MKPLYTIWGKVKKGKQRGKTLGFPTANIALHKKIPEGIYTSAINVENKEYQAVTFIGAAKTFGEKDILAESYILDFQKNIYGKWLSIKLLKKLRDNRKFASQEELITQMKNDVLSARQFFEENP